MIGEVNLYGVFVPALLMCALIAVVLSLLLRVVLRRTGLYRAVWHPALFDIAVFVIILGGVVAFTAVRPLP